jgi:hypothetical protein
MANPTLTTVLCNLLGEFFVDNDANLLFESIRAEPNTEVQVQIGGQINLDQDATILLNFKVPSTGILELGFAFPITQVGRIGAITFTTPGVKPFLLNYRQQV